MDTNPPILTIIPLLNTSQQEQFQQLAIQMAIIIFNDTKKNEAKLKPKQSRPITIKLTHTVITA